MKDFATIQQAELSSMGFPLGDNSFDLDELFDNLYLHEGEMLDSFNSVSYEGYLSCWRHDDIINVEGGHLVHRNILYWAYKGECLILYVNRDELFLAKTRNTEKALYCMKSALKTCDAME